VALRPFTIHLARSNVLEDEETLIDLPQQTSERCLNASSELDQLRQENELFKIQNEQLKRQIEQWRESIKKHNERIGTLEEIIEERDGDLDTVKKEIGGSSIQNSALMRH
jgi:chromosome segregation ATPase